jgi:hypothetical protein
MSRLASVELGWISKLAEKNEPKFNFKNSSSVLSSTYSLHNYRFYFLLPHAASLLLPLPAFSCCFHFPVSLPTSVYHFDLLSEMSAEAPADMFAEVERKLTEVLAEVIGGEVQATGKILNRTISGLQCPP